jgi:hypothetical protein
MEQHVPLSNEELLHILSTSKEIDTPLNKPKNKHEEILAEVEQFILVNDIKAGTSKIKRYQIMELFRKWSKSKTKEREIMRKFGTIFKFHVSDHRNPRYYLLDPTPFDTGQQYIFARREAYRNKLKGKLLREKEKHSANKEKQDEVSRTDSQCPPEDKMGTD